MSKKKVLPSAESGCLIVRNSSMGVGCSVKLNEKRSKLKLRKAIGNSLSSFRVSFSSSGEQQS